MLSSNWVMISLWVFIFKSFKLYFLSAISIVATLSPQLKKSAKTKTIFHF